MKKCISVIVSVLLVGILFFSCSDGSSNSAIEGSSTQNPEKGDDGTKKNPDEGVKTPAVVSMATSKVKFDFSGATALAKLESSDSPVSSRAVDSADELGDFVKILADNTMETAIMVEEGAYLSEIIAVYKSPIDTSNDVFVVFQDVSTLSSEWNEETGQFTQTQIGQLICVHEDGTVADILKVSEEELKSNINSTEEKYANNNVYIGLKEDSIQFDVNGNVYFISAPWRTSYGSVMNIGEVIYQFNPSTGELTQMVAAVQDTSYNKLQIDKTGQYIFVSGSRSSSRFLRAIPISNPNNFVNVFFSSTDGIRDTQWLYDDNSETIYYYVGYSANNDAYGLYKATKAGGFTDKQFIHKKIGENFEFTLLDSFAHGWTPYYWVPAVQTDGKLDAEKAIEFILKEAYHKETYSYKEVTYSDNEVGWEPEWKDFHLTTDMIDIRFDNEQFKDADGVLRALYLLSSGKRNEEALRAFDSEIGRSVLSCVKSVTARYDAKTNSSGSYCENNFLADIFYEKGTDTLLKDSEKVLFSYIDSAHVTREIKGKDIFEKNSFGYTDSGNFYVVNAANQWNSSICTFAVTKQFYDDDALNASKLLDYLFSYCTFEGNKEFRLTAFNDDKTYGALYSDKTNEEAWEWLSSDVERINLLGNCFGNPNADPYNEPDRYYKGAESYSSFMNFIAKTCFITGTNEKATSWNTDEIKEISYEHIDELSADENGVFGIFTNVYNWGTSDTPYFYIIQIADATGKIVELENKLPLPFGRTVRSQRDSKRLVMQYSLLDEYGSELGYHHIYSVDLETGTVTNCFDNVPNRNGLEVVSFSSAGDLLYYSAVRGTSVENGIVDITTNEYAPLSVNRKWSRCIHSNRIRRL